MKDPLFNAYMMEGFKALRCKGYHPRFNPKKDLDPEREYKAAKEPVDKGYTENNFVGLTPEEIQEWLNQGGWIGWVIPKGHIAIDSENKDSRSYIENICTGKNIEPSIHNSNNGKHYLFKLNGQLPAKSEAFTKSGVGLTYRVGGKSQLILAPINKRSWETWKPLKDLPELPEGFYPYDPNDINDVLRCLSWQVGLNVRNGLLQGFEDIDFSFMALLIECGFTKDQIHEAFQLVFFHEYDSPRTTYIYQRTKEKFESGESVRGVGSFVQHVRSIDLQIVERFYRELQRLTGANKQASSQIHDKSNITLTRLDDLLNEPEELVAWQVEGILPAGGFSVLASKPKVGKSTLVRNLALCTAQGKPFLNRQVNKGPVIYLALEEKKAEVKRHFRDMGATGEEEIYIYASSAPVDALKQIRELAERIRPVLISIDPLFRLARIKDGNDYAQVTQALDPLLRLARDTGSHVLCTHHQTKGDRSGGDSVLGSTAIFSSVDTLMIMKRHENYRTIQTIQRYGEDLEEATLHFDKETRTVSIGKSKKEEDIATLEGSILEFLSAHIEPVIEMVIMDEVEGRTGLKRRALRELVRKENVSREGKGGKGDPFKYSCSLVPNIHAEQENENPEIDLKPSTDTTNACSEDLTEIDRNAKSREREFLSKEDGKCNSCMRRSTCILSSGQRKLCGGPF